MATIDPAGRRLSTEDVCREAAERLGQIHIRSFRDETEPSKNSLLLEEIRQQDRPPPYSPSFLVPPPPPPSPGDALRAQELENMAPIPSAPPPPPLPQHHQQPRQDNITPVPTAGVDYLQVHTASPAVLQDGSLGPSPMHVPHAYPPSPAYTTPVTVVQPDMPMASQPQMYYPPPTQVPATSTPLMVQPPPPPPPPPPPLAPSVQQTTNNQNINANMNNVNVNVGNGVKERLYPNYLSFSIILCLLCWLFNPIVYICVIPALLCSCYSCSTNTYGKSKFSGKWAFACDLTALICGLISFVLLILPLVIVLVLAATGGIAALYFLDNHENV